METVVHSTFVIERSYPVGPERVFAAFADPEKKRRWFVERDHHEVDEYALDFRVGGKETARFRFKAGTPVAGMACATDTVFLDIVPNSRIVMAGTMNLAGLCISATMGTVELSASSAGTDVVFTHYGAFFEGADGPKMREEGWRKLLDELAKEAAR